MEGWTVIIPVKPWNEAKTRLEVDPTVKTALARAFFEDVLTVAIGCPRVATVAVVSREPGVIPIVDEVDARLFDEPGTPETRGLNSAVATGVSWARSQAAEQPVAVVPADLPAITSAALAEVLELASEHERSFVPDMTGEGTTVLCAKRPSMLSSAYGDRSAARHVQQGATPIAQVDRRARQDVDDLDGLRAAIRLGPGRRTVVALERHEDLLVGAMAPWSRCTARDVDQS